VSLLERKLLRDIGTLRGQVVTIASVVAAGVAVFVASISTYDSLLAGRDHFYASGRPAPNVGTAGFGQLLNGKATPWARSATSWSDTFIAEAYYGLGT
jgi:hypothetical protein